MANICDLSAGSVFAFCKNNIGGIRAIYLANFGDYDFVTSSTSAGHLLTDLGELDVVYKYAVKNSGNVVSQESVSNVDNGTTVFNTTLTFLLNRMTPKLEFQLKMMTWGRPIIFVEGNNGQVLAYGLKNGNEVSYSGGIGGTTDAFSGYTITAVGSEADPHWHLGTASITALKALVSTSDVDTAPGDVDPAPGS